MGSLEFISSLIGSISWPIAIVILTLVLRRPISRILAARPVKTFKAGPTGIEIEYFDEILKDARVEVQEGRAERRSLSTGGATAQDTNRVDQRGDFMDEMSKLATISLSAVILESYARLERALRSLLDPSPEMIRRNLREALGSDDFKVKYTIGSVRTLSRAAADMGVITPAEVGAIQDLSVLRSAVAHQSVQGLDRNRALSYAATVADLLVTIEAAAIKAGNEQHD